MSEEQPEDEGLKKALETRFEDLFLDEDTPAYTPDLDVEDEDVVDLGLDSGVYEAVESGVHEDVRDSSDDDLEEESPEDPELGELEYEELEVDPALEAEAVDWTDESRFVKDSGRFSGRYSAIFAAAVGGPKSLPERALIGLLLANVVLIGLMFLVPEVFEGSEDTAKETTGSVVAPRATTSNAGSRSTRDRVPEPKDPNVMPDPERYESAQDQIGRGNYEKATELLEAYLADHPDLSLLQRQAVFSGLLYCARRVGDGERSVAHGARVASLRRLSATPDELWTEAKEAAVARDGAKMRRLYARMLLQQDRLLTDPKKGNRLDALRAGFADSYRFESERRKAVR